MSALNDLTRRTFGALHVIKRVENDGRYPQWLCRCDCGNEVVIRGYNLKSGSTTSCGCQTRPNHFVHGFSHKERLYTIWKGMNQRCTDPKWRGAKYWHEKGVTVCAEWREYPVFREWALSAGYKDGLSIDRIDNDGDYCPQNCRWATNKEQANNRSKNRKLTLRGETKTMSEWAEIVNIPYTTIKYRLYAGWSDEQALTTPVRRQKNNASP